VSPAILRQSLGILPDGLQIPALHLLLHEPPEDIEAAKKVYFGFYNDVDNWTWNVSWYSDPVILGHYPKEGLEKYKEYLPEITKEDMELIHQPIDFYGQNIYNGYLVRAGADGEPEFETVRQDLPKDCRQNGR